MIHSIKPAAKPAQPTLRTPLLPWLVVSHGAISAPDRRMMWAQSGINRLFAAFGDLSLALRAAMAKFGRSGNTPRSTATTPAE